MHAYAILIMVYAVFFLPSYNPIVHVSFYDLAITVAGLHGCFCAAYTNGMNIEAF